MSGSERAQVEVVGTSDAEDPVEALREALAEVLAGLAGQRCGPHHLVSMRWEVADVARFHPSRREIELAYREVFAGFRVPVSLARLARKGLRAVATARRPSHGQSRRASAAPVYRSYTFSELGRQYAPRLQADMTQVFRQWSRDGACFRAAHTGLDLAYGPHRDESFDLYLPPDVARPQTWVFVHGGAWQASDKLQHAQFAQGMLAAGHAVAMPNYGLAPETSLAGMVEQLSRLLTVLVREAPNLDIDGTRLHLAGHSAGGHLAAMLAARDFVPTIRSVLLLSGLFDLAPLALMPIARPLRLRPPLVASMSPLQLPAPAGLRIGLAVGELETDEFKRQSQLLAEAWHAPAPLIVPGHHFSMLDGLNGGSLLGLARSLVEG